MTKENKETENDCLLSKAIELGYIHLFYFIDGLLYCELDLAKEYLPKDVHFDIQPLFQGSIILYCITTENGLKGYAILDIEQIDTD